MIVSDNMKRMYALVVNLSFICTIYIRINALARNKSKCCSTNMIPKVHNFYRSNYLMSQLYSFENDDDCNIILSPSIYLRWLIPIIIWIIKI